MATKPSSSPEHHRTRRATSAAIRLLTTASTPASSIRAIPRGRRRSRSTPGIRCPATAVTPSGTDDRRHGYSRYPRRHVVEEREPVAHHCFIEVSRMRPAADLFLQPLQRGDVAGDEEGSDEAPGRLHRSQPAGDHPAAGEVDHQCKCSTAARHIVRQGWDVHVALADRGDVGQVDVAHGDGAAEGARADGRAGRRWRRCGYGEDSISTMSAWVVDLAASKAGQPRSPGGPWSRPGGPWRRRSRRHRPPTTSRCDGPATLEMIWLRAVSMRVLIRRRRHADPVGGTWRRGC